MEQFTEPVQPWREVSGSEKWAPEGQWDDQETPDGAKNDVYTENIQRKPPDAELCYGLHMTVKNQSTENLQFWPEFSGEAWFWQKYYKCKIRHRTLNENEYEIPSKWHKKRPNDST